MIVYGTLLMRSACPTTSRDPANRVCHNPVRDDDDARRRGAILFLRERPPEDGRDA